MTTQEMKEIVEKAPFETLKKDEGISEYHQVGDISIGVSYETDEADNGREVYVWNLFLLDDYINISERTSTKERCSSELLKELSEMWNELEKLD